MEYRQSGVDIDAGNDAVRRIRSLARSTFTSDVLSDIGSFGGLFRLDHSACEEPVLVSSADGVGTKLKVAFMTGRHDSIGADLVNHCVNDILVQGARPLFFLDYLATGRLSPEVAEQIISGVAGACRGNGCALIGGETAEMPGFYQAGEYDLAGFIVGLVDRRRIIDGRTIERGDVLVGLPSAGLHTNGYSLARHVVFDRLAFGPERFVDELETTVAEALLAPHRSYLGVLRPAIDSAIVKGMAHITGGGLTENVPRILPEGSEAVIRRGSWRVPPIFGFLQRSGSISDDEMYRVFNMGIGMVVVCAPARLAQLLKALEDAGEVGASVIGRVESGSRGVRYVGTQP